eukprot:TRINITY_DN4692_c0_g1_i1.p1 TRINITY_DN4692_c0_g1~~TRINITY_DN4692_c0_g1_i1.p1  ORF type:complete len:131 (+),score=18.99 TRINITY_DN4692_c0_g1_i1:229-621(+)
MLNEVDMILCWIRCLSSSLPSFPPSLSSPLSLPLPSLLLLTPYHSIVNPPRISYDRSIIMDHLFMRVIHQVKEKEETDMYISTTTHNNETHESNQSNEPAVVSIISIPPPRISYNTSIIMDHLMMKRIHK